MPSKHSGYSAKISCPIPLTKPTRRTPSCSAVFLPSKDFPFPSITYKSALIDICLKVTMHENIPITFKGVSEPYASIFFVDVLLPHFTCFFFIMFHVHWLITLHEAPESISISITTPPTSSATCPFSSCDRLKTYSGLSSIGCSSTQRTCFLTLLEWLTK